MRHIPTRDTRTLDRSFDAQLKQALEPNDSYDVQKWLYVPCAYTEYRYILGTRGEKPLIAVGINPSTAAPDRLDRTLQSVDRIRLGNGYDFFLMFNVCAQRATDPNDMDPTGDEDLHRENMKAFRFLLSLSPQPVIWAAWGNLIEKRPYLSACVREMALLAGEAGARWVTCGPRSLRGHPHHPLYLKSDLPLDPFDISAYLSLPVFREDK